LLVVGRFREGGDGGHWARGRRYCHLVKGAPRREPCPPRSDVPYSGLPEDEKFRAIDEWLQLIETCRPAGMGKGQPARTG